MMRRCLICTRRDDPTSPRLPVHEKVKPRWVHAKEVAYGDNGYVRHDFDPGERRDHDLGGPTLDATDDVFPPRFARIVFPDN